MSVTTLNGTGSGISKFNKDSTIPFWLNGEEVIGDSVFEVVSPVGQTTLYQCSSATEQDVFNAVSAAERAFQSWSTTKPSVRRNIFLRAADEFRRRRDELRHYSLTETGAAEAMFAFEHNAAYEACKSVAGLIQVAMTSSSPVIDVEDGSALLIKEPFGVILGIAPWSAPNVLGLRACLQPLAMCGIH